MENPPKNGKSTSSSPLTHLENPPLGLREGKIETGNHQFSHQEKRAFRFRFSLKPIPLIHQKMEVSSPRQIIRFSQATFDVHGASVSEGSARCPDDPAASAPQIFRQRNRPRMGIHRDIVGI